MSELTPSDIIRSDECNTYVMSCHLNKDELYKVMRDDIAMMCKEYSTLKAHRDELLTAAKSALNSCKAFYSSSAGRHNVDAAILTLTAAITKLERVNNGQ